MKTNYHFLRYVIISVMAAALWSCTSGDKPENRTDNRPIQISLTSEQKKIVTESNQFAIDLFKTVSKTSDDNQAISPMSMGYMLSMLANGASGNTLDEFLTLLGSSNIDELNALYSTYQKELPRADALCDLKIANSLWMSESFRFNPEFSRELSTLFDAETVACDFGSGNQHEVINNWVSDHTDGMIKQLLKSPAFGPLVTVNALCFKGEWKEKFNPASTNSDDFHNIDGSISKADMMHASGRVAVYKDTPSFGAIWLPYGNGSFSMVIMMPKEGLDFNEIVATLTSADLTSEAQGKSSVMEFNLAIPKFRISDDQMLGGILAEMGLSSAFLEDSADFSRISDSHLCMNEVYHSVVVEVDENGTTAAAGSANDTFTSPSFEKGEFIVDSPFLFFIQENSTGAILICGKVTKF